MALSIKCDKCPLLGGIQGHDGVGYYCGANNLLLTLAADQETADATVRGRSCDADPSDVMRTIEAAADQHEKLAGAHLANHQAHLERAQLARRAVEALRNGG